MFKIFKRNKKGVSPLIATVLLIGFTIVLAALVFRFGGNLFRTTTEETACNSLIALQCAQSTDIKVTNVKVDDAANILNVTIENKNEGIVSGFVFVLKEGDQSPITIALSNDPKLPLQGFVTSTYNLTYTGTKIPVVEVTPIIERTDTEGNLCTGSCIQKKQIYKPAPQCGDGIVQSNLGEECEIGQQPRQCGPPPQPNGKQSCTSECKWGTCLSQSDQG